MYELLCVFAQSVEQSCCGRERAIPVLHQLVALLPLLQILGNKIGNHVVNLVELWPEADVLPEKFRNFALKFAGTDFSEVDEPALFAKIAGRHFGSHDDLHVFVEHGVQSKIIVTTLFQFALSDVYQCIYLVLPGHSVKNGKFNTHLILRD
ncbi:MAG: hypothetical protein ACD_39C00835G0002 [uncultured bacterium]|nr:MAG: hypothetical protein ACD_39C00835G0002 [uncultured bacterium]